MSDVFISHVEEDADIALEIALGLGEAGYTTWCYEVDSIPGPSYLIQTGQAIEQSKAVILVISPHSLGSRQITREVVGASERNKEFIPVRRDITHVEFQNRQPEWRQAVGAAASIGIPRQGVAGVLPRIIDGIKSLGIHPRLKTDAGRIVQIRKAIDELQGRSMLEETEEPPVPTRKSELEDGVEEMPEEKVMPPWMPAIRSMKEWMPAIGSIKEMQESMKEVQEYVKGRVPLAKVAAINTSPKSRWAVTLLACFIGVLGAHRFYLGKTRTAVGMLALSVLFCVFYAAGYAQHNFAGVVGDLLAVLSMLCIGAVGIWALIDFIFAVTGKMKDKRGKPIKNW